MKKPRYFLAILCILFGTGAAEKPFASSPQSSSRLAYIPGRPARAIPAPTVAKPAAIKEFGKIPLYFTPNAGQLDGPAEFYVRGKDKTVYYTPDGVTYSLRFGGKRSSREPRESVKMGGRKFGPAETKDIVSTKLKGWAVKMDFVGANPNVKPQGLDQTGAEISYFKGKSEEWKTGLPAYSRIIYKDLWPGIDLVCAGQTDRLKYEFIVHPGSDPKAIELAWRGAERIQVDESGRLEIKTPAGSFCDETPSAYQKIEGRQATVDMGYDLREWAGQAERPAERAAMPAYSCGFKVGAYDKTRDLVLDPATIVYCGYIGGADDDEGLGIAVDGSGNVYVTGYACSDQTTFPVTVGPDLSYNGGANDWDAFVARVNAAGTALVYCGYIGGEGDDLGNGIAVDRSGNAYITGSTDSDQTTFPAIGGPDLSFNESGWDDAFVAKVNAAGTVLVYCGYIGGEGDDSGNGIAVDRSGNAYITGSTDSDQTTFPAIGGPDLSFNESGWDDAFVAKVNAAGTALVYCGYIGGEGDDSGNGIAVDRSGNAYVTGSTDSDQTTFPAIGGPDLTYNGEEGYDAFVAEVNDSGTALVYCGYIGGEGDDSGNGIAVDGLGNAYVTGSTDSDQTTFPVIGGPDLSYNDTEGWGDAFVAKVNASGSALVYCGYIGGSDLDWGNGIAVDGSGNAHVTGLTYSDQTTFPAIGGPDLTYNGDGDAFAAKIDASGKALVYCGYIGGDGEDEGYGIAVDGSGNDCVTGYTDSDQETFPVTGGPDLKFNSDWGHDAFVAKLGANVDTSDVSVTKTTDNLTPKFGENFNFTVTATNNGPGGASRLKIADSLPEGLAYVSSTASKGTYASAAGIWDIGTLPNGGTATLTIGTRGTSRGAITNTASVSELNESDPVSSNDSASASVTVGNAFMLTIIAGAGGTTKPEAGTYAYDEGAVVSVTATAAPGYSFLGWSGDATGTANPVSITMTGNITVTANFIHRYTLTIIAGAGGTTNPVPGTYTYDEGTSVGVQANPSAGYQFDDWTGDASGSTNPVTVVMNGDITIQANFSRAVKPPLDLTGGKHANRSLSMVEYVAHLKWQANAANSGSISYRVYQIENGQATAIADVGAGTYEYIIRRLQAARAYRFGVTAVSSKGWESDMVEIALQ